MPPAWGYHGRMILTKVERLILYNQFRILEKLDPDSARYSQQACDILQGGYTLEYDSLVQMGNEVPEDTSREVVEILQMYRDLKNASLRLPAGSFDGKQADFKGFDGNEEGEHHAYATFMIEDQGKWMESKGLDLNSHWPMLDRYRPMLEAWKQSSEKHKLTVQDVTRILAAAS
jgi:uncharacterized protein YfbU (UPF0304 family)